MLIKTNSTVNKIVRPFTKIDFRYNKTTLAFMDVFPSDYMMDIDEKKSKNLKDIHLQYRKILNKDKKKLPKILEKVNKELCLCDDGKYIIRGFEDGIYKFKYVESDVVFPLGTIEYEGEIFPCPNDSDAYLESIYGESFREIPQVVRAHGFHTRLSQKEDIINSLKINVEFLQNANKNFK